MKIVLPCSIVCALLQGGCDKNPKRTEIGERQIEVQQNRSPFEGRWQFEGANHPWYSDLTIYGYSGILQVDGNKLAVTFTKVGRFDEYYSALIPVAHEDRAKDSVTYEGVIIKYIFKDGDMIKGDLSDAFGDDFYTVKGLPFEDNVQIQISQDNSSILLLGSQDPPWTFAKQNTNKEANKVEMGTPR